jgi:hypothetical protein
VIIWVKFIFCSLNNKMLKVGHSGIINQGREASPPTAGSFQNVPIGGLGELLRHMRSVSPLNKAVIQTLSRSSNQFQMHLIPEIERYLPQVQLAFLGQDER